MTFCFAVYFWGCFVFMLFGIFGTVFVIAGETTEKRVGLLFILLAASFIIGGYYLYDRGREYTVDIPIYSLQDVSKIEGSFVLGTGSISSGPVYWVYQAAGKGGYQITPIPGSAIIYEDEENAPYIRTIHNTCENKQFDGCYSCQYEIHVPKGTIIKEYNLDSKP